MAQANVSLSQIQARITTASIILARSLAAFDFSWVGMSRRQLSIKLHRSHWRRVERQCRTFCCRAAKDYVDRRKSLRHCRSPFPGNRIAGQRQRRRKAPVTFNRSSAETKRPLENPPVRCYLHDTGKSLFAWSNF